MRPIDQYKSIWIMKTKYSVLLYVVYIVVMIVIYKSSDFKDTVIILLIGITCNLIAIHNTLKNKNG